MVQIPIDKTLLDELIMTGNLLIAKCRMGGLAVEAEPMDIILDCLDAVIYEAEHIPDGGDEMTDLGLSYRQLEANLKAEMAKEHPRRTLPICDGGGWR